MPEIHHFLLTEFCGLIIFTKLLSSHKQFLCKDTHKHMKIYIYMFYSTENMIQLLWDYHSPLPRCVTCPLTASAEGLQSPFLWPGTFLQPLSAFHSAPWFHHPEKANKKFCSAQRCQYLWHFKYDINVHVFYPVSKFMNFNHKVSF